MSEEYKNLETETEPVEETIQEPEQEDVVDSQTEPETETNNDKVDYYSMSDEEFLKFYDSIGTEPEPESTKEEVEEEDKKVESEPVEEKEESKQEEEPKKEDTINYKGFYDRVMSGFKANGKIIKPKSEDDVISILQMGAGFGKKMSQVKHMTKQVSSLEDAGITSLEDINYLIDLYKGDKEAIKKLIKDHNYDIYDLDLDDIKYDKNTKNILSDDSVNFRSVLNDMKDEEYFPKLYEVVDKKWDSESKKAILNDTRLLEGLKQEFELNRFDIIQNMVEEERTFGRLTNVSDLEAYRTMIGKAFEEGIIDSNGRLVDKSKPKPTKKVVKDIDVNKSAVKPTSSAKPQTEKKRLSNKEIFNMNDEEFNKLFDSGYFD